MSRQVAEYAAYLDLPTTRDFKGALDGPQVPTHLLADLSEDAYRCEAVDLAHQIVSEQTQWVESQERQEEDRKERQEALRAARASPRRGGGYPSEFTPVVASSGGDDVIIEFHLPPKGTPVHVESFKYSASAFDLYGKVYELLADKERDFSINFVGPYIYKMKKLDEATWSSTLSDLGMRAESTYTLYVSQV